MRFPGSGRKSQPRHFETPVEDLETKSKTVVESSLDGETFDDLRARIRTDPELQKLSLHEKKALIVNKELDNHGMGEQHQSPPELCLEHPRC